MAQKDRPRAAAVIDIGSSALSMEIAQAGADGPEELDYLEYPVNLGYETFTHGKVSFRAMEEVARALDGFSAAFRQYGVEDDAIRIMATTALREASNSTYVLDQLVNKTGRHVEVLEDGQEMALIFKEVLRRMDAQRLDIQKPFMIAYIGTGSVGIAAVREGAVCFARNIRMGSLKLSQMLGETGERTPRFYVILEEYLSALTRLLRDQMQSLRPGRFVVCGKEIELIAGLTHTVEKDGLLTIDRRVLSQLYDEIKALTPAQVSQKFKLRGEQGEVLLPSLAIYMTLSEFTNADAVLSPSVALVDSMLYELLFPKEAKEWNRRFEEGIAASAWEMARRYQTDINHAEAVTLYAMRIFDTLKKTHGFSRHERRLLEAAAALHDIGKFVNSKFHELYSCHILLDSNIIGKFVNSKFHEVYTCHILLDSNIIGVSNEEMAMIANIARYHSGPPPMMSHPEWAALPPENRLAVSKLAAMLRLADALDRSHTQKLEEIELKQRDNELIITGRTERDVALEQWTFGYKSELFTEVFGLRCVFRKKGRD